MGDPLQLGVGEETAGPLDGMDRPEDAVERLAIPRVVLDRHEVAFKLVKVLVTLDQELSNGGILFVHQ